VLHSRCYNNLKWRRGIEVKQIKSHIRLEVIIAVDNKGKAYASEIKMLNQILNKVDFIKGLPFNLIKVMIQFSLNFRRIF
jgi:hypothetical protein